MAGFFVAIGAILAMAAGAGAYVWYQTSPKRSKSPEAP